MAKKGKKLLAFGYALTLDALVVVFEVLGIALLVFFQLFVMFFTIYQTTLSVAGLFKREKRLPLSSTENHKFALLVAAHNEQEVVGQIVDNLLNEMNYPKEMYDVYVICDNCTDETAKVVREHGGNAMERHEPEKRGKGFGLEWMFEHLWNMEKEGKKYDAVAMFDADNVVSQNFLVEVNKKLNQGFEVIQGYLDTKNPEDTWVTKSYAFAYWSTNRLYQLSREKLGLSAQLGGTGVVVSTKMLKEIGWGATSLTEDLEFTARYILKTGKRVAWAHKAKIYDEKPLEFKQTWKQRVRWMAGHVDCMIRYAIPLLKMAITKRSLVAFDAAVYLTQPARTLLSLSTIAFFILAIYASVYRYEYLFISRWVWLSITLIYFALPGVALLIERKSKAIGWYVSSYLFSLTWIPVTLFGFIKRKERTWNSTKHTRKVSGEEMKKLIKGDKE